MFDQEASYVHITTKHDIRHQVSIVPDTGKSASCGRYVFDILSEVYDVSSSYLRGAEKCGTCRGYYSDYQKRSSEGDGEYSCHA